MSVAWKGDLLTLGQSDGTVLLHDVRVKTQISAVTGGHRKRIVGLSWDATGNYLASGDIDGYVHIWDHRTHKPLTHDPGKGRSKMRHKAPVKVWLVAMILLK